MPVWREPRTNCLLMHPRCPPAPAFSSSSSSSCRPWHPLLLLRLPGCAPASSSSSSLFVSPHCLHGPPARSTGHHLEIQPAAHSPALPVSRQGEPLTRCPWEPLTSLPHRVCCMLPDCATLRRSSCCCALWASILPKRPQIFLQQFDGFASFSKAASCSRSCTSASAPWEWPRWGGHTCPVSQQPPAVFSSEPWGQGPTCSRCGQSDPMSALSCNLARLCTGNQNRLRTSSTCTPARVSVTLHDDSFDLCNTTMIASSHNAGCHLQQSINKPSSA